MPQNDIHTQQAKGESDAGTAKQTKERLSPSELKFENSRV